MCLSSHWPRKMNTVHFLCIRPTGQGKVIQNYSTNILGRGRGLSIQCPRSKYVLSFNLQSLFKKVLSRNTRKVKVRLPCLLQKYFFQTIFLVIIMSIASLCSNLKVSTTTLRAMHNLSQEVSFHMLLKFFHVFLCRLQQKHFIGNGPVSKFLPDPE